MAKILDTKVASPRTLNVGLDGVGGSGKTSLLHLPSKGPTWETPSGAPGKMVYLASDPTSRRYRSFSEEMRNRLIPVIPDGNPTEVEGTDPRTKEKVTYIDVNWRSELARLCQTDWAKEYPDVVAFAWDTNTYSAEHLLAESAQKADFSEKGASNVGKSKSGVGKEEGIAMPQEGDYHMVQKMMWRNLNWLAYKNPNIHIFVLFHECYNTDIRKFGPMHVGTKGPLQIPQHFDLHAHVSIEKGKTRVDFRHPDRVTNLKCPRPELVPDFKLVEPTQEAREQFWEWVLEVQNG